MIKINSKKELDYLLRKITKKSLIESYQQVFENPDPYIKNFQSNLANEMEKLTEQEEELPEEELPGVRLLAVGFTVEQLPELSQANISKLYKVSGLSPKIVVLFVLPSGIVFTKFPFMNILYSLTWTLSVAWPQSMSRYVEFTLENEIGSFDQTGASVSTNTVVVVVDVVVVEVVVVVVVITTVLK